MMFVYAIKLPDNVVTIFIGYHGIIYVVFNDVIRIKKRITPKFFQDALTANASCFHYSTYEKDEEFLSCLDSSLLNYHFYDYIHARIISSFIYIGYRGKVYLITIPDGLSKKKLSKKCILDLLGDGAEGDDYDLLQITYNDSKSFFNKLKDETIGMNFIRWYEIK